MNKKYIYIGWDIGGAHTKYTISSNNSVKSVSYIVPLQLWKSLDPLKELINDIHDKYNMSYTIINGFTMSGEMCDIFTNREEGVKKILSLFNRSLSKNYIYTSKYGIIPIKKYINYEYIASMNWHIIAYYLKDFYKNIIAIDTGSTTTDIMLIKNNKCINQRVDDHSGLKSTELMYTGILRTPIFSVVKYISFNRQKYYLIPEYYATMADIYRVLGVIEPKEDYSATADGRSKSQLNTFIRISRSLGFDYTSKYKKLILGLARKIMSEHLHQISYNIHGHVIKRFSDKKDLKFIGMGIGRNIIKKICKKNSWDYADLTSLIYRSHSRNKNDPSISSPSFLLSLLLKEKYEHKK